MCILSIKVPIRKKSGNLFNDPHSFCALPSNMSFRYKLVWPNVEWPRISKLIFL